MANMKSTDFALPLKRVAPPRGSQAVQATRKGRTTAGRTTTRGRGRSVASDPVGVFAPLGEWDPAGYTTKSDATDAKIAYYREAELKHGRVCMLASLGFFVQERFHPLFGGDIDVPALQSFSQTELQLFWPAVLLVTGGIELATGTGRFEGDKELADGLVPGDIGFDPLGLKNNYDEEEFLDIQNKELAHARLAMISTLGMISQELAFPAVKLYGA